MVYEKKKNTQLLSQFKVMQNLHLGYFKMGRKKLQLYLGGFDLLISMLNDASVLMLNILRFWWFFLFLVMNYTDFRMFQTLCIFSSDWY